MLDFHLRTAGRVLKCGLFCWLLLYSLSGCHRRAAERPRSGSTPAVGPLADGQPLSRADILLEIANIPHAEVGARLGAHRIESKTRFTITPLGSTKTQPDVAPGFRADSPVRPFEGAAAWESAPASLEETRMIQLDRSGRLELQNLNDHGYGVEAIHDTDYLYVRMRNAPYVRRHPEGDEVERLRALAYESGGALLEAVAPFVYLGTPTETTRLSRPAWQVTISRQQPTGRHRGHDVAGQAWRCAVAVDKLEGYAVVDRQRGALLELQLAVRFVAPRSATPPGSASVEGERVQVEAQHEMRVVALGDQVAAVSLPTEWNDPPLRNRPTLDRQELLNGLVPTRP